MKPGGPNWRWKKQQRQDVERQVMMEALRDVATYVGAPKSGRWSHLKDQIGGPFHIVQPRRLVRIDSSQCDLR